MRAPVDVPVVILCGGRGTRLQAQSAAIPKPLVEIGGLPILWHVMQIYAAQGFRNFLLAAGYKHELISEFVADHQWPDGLQATCIDTGLDTPTGGRLAALRERLDHGSFCVTYADGLADVDLVALWQAHAEREKLATITLVRPQLQFGVAELGPDGLVTGFEEKPRSEHWINGGFLCLEPGVFDYLQADSVLEREPLQKLAAAQQLNSYRHGRFWGCMDTYKDALALNDLWRDGGAPWKLW